MITATVGTLHRCGVNGASLRDLSREAVFFFIVDCELRVDRRVDHRSALSDRRLGADTLTDGESDDDGGGDRDRNGGYGGNVSSSSRSASNINRTSSSGGGRSGGVSPRSASARVARRG